MDKQAKGKLGEDAVRAELERRGHAIIAVNYRKRVGEIDIISQIGRYIVFTEVKTRKLGSMVSGLEAVNFTKQKKIVLTADAYLTENPTELQPRYDVAEVTVTRGEFPRITGITIYEDAFTTDGIYTVN
ncbi:MAG: YraN family protein [Lachnospiraceae bacterium]|nr:YraN family protein [Ruminococcus sp.]MCM1275873.1 YraN family protein [Lachnospiraceae bacterium]